MMRLPLILPRRPTLLLCAALLLTACNKEPVAYLIDGSDHSLTIERNKAYFWSSGWEIDLIVARFPACQRRYALKKSSEKLRIDLFRTDTDAYILKQGKRWYVAETQECRMQAFDSPPPQPGVLVGSFRLKNGLFAFVASDPDSKNGKDEGE